MRRRNNIFAAAFDYLKREQGVKTQKELARRMGVSEDTITRILKDRTDVTEDIITKLQTASDCIFNLQWLRGEDAPMLASMVEMPVVTMEPTKGKPYYNVDFRLGFDIMTNNQTTNPDYMIDFPPYNDVDCWVNAHGDSMAPTISSGDIVALKHIEDHSYLINGEIYAIVTTNGLRTIKRIRDNGETFTLIADNHEVGEQIIPKQLVTHVYHVRGTIKMF